jgi:hypothetical protein
VQASRRCKWRFSAERQIIYPFLLGLLKKTLPRFEVGRSVHEKIQTECPSRAVQVLVEFSEGTKT